MIILRRAPVYDQQDSPRRASAIVLANQSCDLEIDLAATQEDAGGLTIPPISVYLRWNPNDGRADEGGAERPLATGSRLGKPSRTVWASERLSGRAAGQKGHEDGSEGLCCAVRAARLGERRHQQGCLGDQPRGALVGRGPRATSRTSRTGRFPPRGNRSTVSSPTRGGSGLSGLSGFNSCLWAGPPKIVDQTQTPVMEDQWVLLPVGTSR